MQLSKRTITNVNSYNEILFLFFHLLLNFIYSFQHCVVKRQCPVSGSYVRITFPQGLNGWWCEIYPVPETVSAAILCKSSALKALFPAA